MLTATLEQLFPDPRSKEFVCKLTLENRGTDAVEIVGIDRQTPAGVEAQEVFNASLASQRATYDKLCQELSTLTTEHLLSESAAYREVLARRIDDALVDVSQATVSPNHLIKLALRWSFTRALPNLLQNLESWVIRITTAREALTVYGVFFYGLPDSSTVKKIFATKVARLRDLESSIYSGGTKILARVEPGSTYAATYLFRGDRMYTRTRRYNVAFGCIYRKVGSTEELAALASTSFLVSPNPLVLTMIAVGFALLGFVLRRSLDYVERLNSGSADSFWSIYLTDPVAAPSYLSAAITATIFFNVYGYTEVANRLDTEISWRSALLIGSLCGLFNDKIIAAISALLGA